LDRARRAELIERFDLDPSKRSRTYSKGNRQKVALVAALASDVELLILDEPTAGLDPLMEAVFQDIIRRVNDAGTTVFLSSHILSQVEKLCRRISIIRLGRVVESGTLSQLRHLTRTTIEAETDRPATGLDRLPGVHHVVAEDGRVRFAVDGAHLDQAVRRLSELGIRSLTSHPPTLEELMLRHYGDELRADGIDPAEVER
jgi:ABC-2 type transport system ATP-binding protein